MIDAPLNSSNLVYCWRPPTQSKWSSKRKLSQFFNCERKSLKYVIDHQEIGADSITSADVVSIGAEPKEGIGGIRVEPKYFKRLAIEAPDTLHCISQDLSEVYEKKILLVDDQIYNLDALEIILKYKVGLDVSSIVERASNG